MMIFVTILFLPGGWEWVLILLVVLLFFGGSKIPKLMRGIGKGVKEFNDARENNRKKEEIEEKKAEEVDAKNK